MLQKNPTIQKFAVVNGAEGARIRASAGTTGTVVM